MKWNAQVSIKIRRTDDDGVVEGTEFKSFVLNTDEAAQLVDGATSRTKTISESLITRMLEEA
jgi:hypothetical protein